MRVLAFSILAAFVMAAPARADATGDAVKGKAAFGACAMCHSVETGKNGIGPSLFGVVGRAAGTAPGFKYSAAMTKAGTWTPQTLDAFIAAPKTAVPGTTMPYGGLKDAQKRADLIAYLGTLK